MTETSAPWNGITLGDATAAPYSDQEWAAMWRQLVHSNKANNGPLRGSGVSPDPGLTVLATSPTTKSVNVTSGAALVRGTFYSSDATVNLPVDANTSGNPRIDTVILRKNYVTQTIRLAVLKGTPGATPVPPVLTQADGALWEVPLADLYLANTYSSIAKANITPNRAWANLADGVYLEDVKNSDLTTIETGELVIWDRTVDRAVKTLVGGGDIRDIAGVWVGRTASGGYGRLLVHGIGYVKAGGVIVRGNLLGIQSGARTTFFVGSGATVTQRITLGYALEDIASGEIGLAFIDPDVYRGNAIGEIVTPTQGSTNSAVWVDVHANDVVSVTQKTGRVRVTATFNARFATHFGEARWTLYSDSLAAYAGSSINGLARFAITDDSDINNSCTITIVGIFTGLTPNTSETFRLRHRLDSGAGTIVTDHPIQMYAEEI